MNKKTGDETINYSDAEKVLLGEAPAADPTADWTPEEREKIAELMKQVEPRPVVQVDLRDHFHKGRRITDTGGLTIIIRSVGEMAMCVEVLGKKGRFHDNHEVKIGRFLFKTTQSAKKRTVLALVGILRPKEEAAGGEAEAE